MWRREDRKPIVDLSFRRLDPKPACPTALIENYFVHVSHLFRACFFLRAAFQAVVLQSAGSQNILESLPMGMQFGLYLTLFCLGGFELCL